MKKNSIIGILVIVLGAASLWFSASEKSPLFFSVSPAQQSEAVLSLASEQYSGLSAQAPRKDSVYSSSVPVPIPVRWSGSLLKDYREFPPQGNQPMRREFLLRPPEWHSDLCVIETYEPGTVDHPEPLVQTESYAADEVLAAVADPEELVATLKAEKFSSVFGDQVYLLKLPESSLDAVPDALKKAEKQGIRGISPNAVYHPMTVPAAKEPNDPLFANEWHHSMIESPLGWGKCSETKTVVGVVDCGIQSKHEDLKGNWIEGFCAPGIREQNTEDTLGHGTNCAGVIGARGNNKIGIAGMAWEVKLMPLKAMQNMSGVIGAYSSDILACFDYALNHGVHILNCSFGRVGGYIEAESVAIDALRAKGIILVVAAGNEGMNIDKYPVYPACYPQENIVAVTSLARNETLSWFSNVGVKSVDIAAPGEYIYTTRNNGQYEWFSGTSAATPVVSGALALLRQRYPNKTAKELIARLCDTGDRLTVLKDNVRSGARLNLSSALGVELSELPPPNLDSFMASEALFRDKIRISWEADPNLYYRVYRSTAYSGIRTALGTWVRGTSFMDMEVKRGEILYYWVRSAVDPYGKDASGFSEPVAGTANFPDERYVYGSSGIRFSLAAAQLRLEINHPFSFTRRPSVFGEGYRITGKKRKSALKVFQPVLLDQVKTQYLSEALKLYNPSDLNKLFYKQGVGVEKFLKSAAHLPAFPVIIRCRVRTDTAYQTVDAGYTLQLLPPQVDSILTADTVMFADSVILPCFTTDTIITVSGHYFGQKKPKAWIEYTLSGEKTIRRYPLRVLTSPEFSNGADKPFKSYSDPDSGMSRIQIRLPKRWPAWARIGGRYTLVLDSRIGLGICDIFIIPEPDKIP